MGRTRRNRSKLKTTKNPECLHSDSSVIALLKTLKSLQWANETKLQLRNFSETGRGVCSTGSLMADELLIRIPLKCMISPVIFTPVTFSFLNKNVRLSVQALMSLFLCVEKHKGNLSRWKFYIDSLPYIHPFHWLRVCSWELKYLPAHVTEEMETFRERFECSWYSIKEAINPECICTCCNKYYLHHVITRDVFEWCYHMVNTRSVYIDPVFVRRMCASEPLDLIKDEPNLALCPFLDMFNHSTEAQTTSDIIEHNGEHFYALRTYKHQRKYEQIFISYGAHDNIKLFIEYGFFVPQNKFDTWPISLLELCNKVKIGMSKYKYITSKQLDRDLYVSQTGALSFNLKAALFIATHHSGDYNRVYYDDYTADEIVMMEECVAELLSSQLRYLPSGEISDNVTHKFNEYLNTWRENIVSHLFKSVHAKLKLSA